MDSYYEAFIEQDFDVILTFVSFPFLSARRIVRLSILAYQKYAYL